VKSIRPPDPHSDFASALRLARSAIGRSQEDFDVVSSRTYISNLERGLKVPTLKKVDSLATVLGVHPMTLLALSYLDARTATQADLQELLTRVFDEMAGILRDGSRSNNHP
jgi:transcriptional regulator with XRE-family HTH domain